MHLLSHRADGPLGSPPARTLVLATLAAALGAAGGGAAWVLLHLIGAITELALFHEWGWQAPSFSTLDRGPTIVIAAVVGALIVALLAKWSPTIKGHGIPEAMESVLTNQSRVPPRVAIAKPLSAAIAIGTGGPFGAEGPIIVTGGALGSLLGRVVTVSPSERKILLACGAAAGMTAVFGTPLAAVVLATELLLFEFSTRAFVPLVVASAVAGGMHAALFGTGPLFAVPAQPFAGLSRLPWFAGLGLACGLVAVIIVRGLLLIEEGFRKLPLDEFWHPVVGAVGFAVVGLIMPRVLGVGYDVIGDVLTDRLAVGTVAAILIFKLLAWWVALASGTSGGTLAPLLMMGGAFGSLAATAVNNLVPSAHLSVGGCALVAMAAVFGASTRATFASIVFLFELTRNYDVILPLMLAVVLASVVAAALGGDRIMVEKLARRGLRVSGDYGADPLATLSVASVMTTPAITLPVDATIGEATALMASTGHGAFPLVDEDGRCAGIVGRGDLIEVAEADQDGPVKAVASIDVVTVGPHAPLYLALGRILDESVEHLPVIDDEHRLLGMCTRSDILRARKHQMDAERRQEGAWRRVLIAIRPAQRAEFQSEPAGKS